MIVVLLFTILNILLFGTILLFLDKNCLINKKNTTYINYYTFKIVIYMCSKKIVYYINTVNKFICVVNNMYSKQLNILYICYYYTYRYIKLYVGYMYMYSKQIN